MRSGNPCIQQSGSGFLNTPLKEGSIFSINDGRLVNFDVGGSKPFGFDHVIEVSSYRIVQAARGAQPPEQVCKRIRRAGRNACSGTEITVFNDDDSTRLEYSLHFAKTRDRVG